jgi:hypothetical protein
MTAAEILSQLQAVGVGIRLDGDTLVCRPLSKVPADLAEQIRANKPELVAILTEPAPVQTAPPICPRCHQQNQCRSAAAGVAAGRVDGGGARPAPRILVTLRT